MLPIETFEYFAPCPRGLEGVCAGELRAMRIRRVRPLRSGVAFFGTRLDGMRAALWCRTASRVLLVLDRVGARDADALYEGVKGIAWERWLSPDGTLAVDANGTNASLRNTQFTAVRAKDAICDRFRESEGLRPSVSPHDPDVRVNISLHGGEGSSATVALDLVGESLHRRGYRGRGLQVEAPLKEGLAAGMLMLAGWDGIAADGGAFLDPMCGSGTLAIEAAMIAGDVAPGIWREHWGFERWLGFDAESWGSLLSEADERAEAGRKSIPPIHASDKDPIAIEAAIGNARKAHLEECIEFSVADVAALPAPGSGMQCGLIACNPPYGERMGYASQLPALYAALASRLRGAYDGWTLAVITSDKGVDAGLGMAPERTVPLFNGKIEAPLHVYGIGGAALHTGTEADSAPEDAAPVARSSFLDQSIQTAANIEEAFAHADINAAQSACIEAGGISIRVADKGAGQFAARLEKAYRQRRKWARNEGVTCYRIYDADLPDFPLAIDLYEGAEADEGKRWAHVSEYAAPKEIDPAKAARRLSDALSIIGPVLGIEPGGIYLKVRKRARGGSQYAGESSGKPGEMHVIGEAGLLFEVDLAGHLDTGIFLDHRMTREMLMERSRGKSFLNLFAYTGTATVYAAAGGASSTLTVDLSQPYQDWSRRNMVLNGFTGHEHGFVRADCLRWIDENRHGKQRFDLIFCDPPTFSNSASMGHRTFDVQADHVELLIGISRLLTPDGVAVFSCNLRSFKPDVEALSKAGVEIEDITPSTIPEDFSRNPKVHHCFLVRRVGVQAEHAAQGVDASHCSRRTGAPHAAGTRGKRR